MSKTISNLCIRLCGGRGVTYANGAHERLQGVDDGNANDGELGNDANLTDYDIQ